MFKKFNLLLSLAAQCCCLGINEPNLKVPGDFRNHDLSVELDLEETTTSTYIEEVTTMRPELPPIIDVTLITDEGVTTLHKDEKNTNDESLENDMVMVTVPLNEYVLTNFETRPKTVLRLSCEASYPVEWEYSGPGSPVDIHTRSFRHVSKLNETDDYSFSATLDIYKSTVDNTGRYNCQAAEKNVRAQRILYFFMPDGENVFHPTVFQQSKTIKYPDDGGDAVIPCPVQDSAAQIILFEQKTPSGNFEKSNITDHDPSLGYLIPRDQMAARAVMYKCVDEASRQESPVFRLLPAKDYVIRVSPDTSFVKMNPNDPSKTHTFICQGRENVSLVFCGDRQPRLSMKQEFSWNASLSEEYPFVAKFEISQMEVISHFVINCISTTSEEILHTWEMSLFDDVSISKFYFDPSQRYQDARYVCCSRSYYPPKLSYIFCQNPMECNIKKSSLEKNFGDIGEHFQQRVSSVNESCVAFYPYRKYTLKTGVLRCNVQGVSKQVHKDFMYYFNPRRIYQAFTDQPIFNATKVKQLGAIMRIGKSPSKNTLVGEKTRFLCYYSEMFFTNGVLWALEMKNGSTVYLESSYEKSSNVSFSQLSMTFNDTEVKYIECMAPVLNTVNEWKVMAGTVLVKEKPTAQAFLKKSENMEEFETGDSQEIILSKEMYEESNSEVILTCKGSFPLDWLYQGEGIPDMDFKSYRHIAPNLINNLTEYRYSAVLTLSNLSCQTVGKYYCVSASREFSHKSATENLGVGFSLYVIDDENLFTERSGKNSTVKAWDHTMSAIISCSVCNPNVEIDLLKYENETRTWRKFGEHYFGNLTHNRQKGFKLERNMTEEDKFYGLYRCSSRKNASVMSGVTEVLKPVDGSNSINLCCIDKGLQAKPSPWVKQLKIYKNESQTFRCESKYEVTLRFSDDPDGKIRRVNQTVQENDSFKYVASYTTKVGEFSNFTVVNCSTNLNSNDSSKPPKYFTLHTWEFYPDDPKLIDKFHYDNKTDSVVCCTKPYRTPTMDWMKCSSVSECYNRQSSCLVRSSCLEHSSLPSSIVQKNYTDKAKCISVNTTSDRNFGFIRCTVKSVHRIVAQAAVYYHNPDTSYNIFDGYFFGHKMFSKFNASNENIIKITPKVEKETILFNESVKFECKASKFFSASPLIWATENANGTVKYLEGTDLTDDSWVRSSLVTTFNESDWAYLYCIAPVWNSYYNWRNVSIPLTIESPA